MVLTGSKTADNPYYIKIAAIDVKIYRHTLPLAPSLDQSQGKVTYPNIARDYNWYTTHQRKSRP